MASFGQLLRFHRHQCRDPLRGGPLTQERLGELLGETLGDAGYTGAAVSEWERDKSKINEDNRPVLVSLIGTLHRHGGLTSAEEADALLRAGNYRALNSAELKQLFPDQDVEPTSEPLLDTPGEPAYQPLSKERRKQLILLEKVRSFWVEGVLEKTTAESNGIAPKVRLANESVSRPWDGIVEEVVAEECLTGEESPLALYEHGDRSLLILGEPGAGKTMMLLSLAKALIKQAEQDAAQPIPVVLNLVTWATDRESLEAWAVEELTAKYMIPRQLGRQWLADDALVLLLDGYDDVPERQRGRCGQTINAFRSTHGLSGLVVCSRSIPYATAGVQLKLGMAVELQSLEDKQIDGYLDQQGRRLESLRSAVTRDETLHEMARNPLMLNLMSLAYDDVEGRQSVEIPVNVPAPLGTRRQRLFSAYVGCMYSRQLAGAAFSSQQTTRWLSWLSRQMYRFQQAPFLIEQIQPSWLPSRRWRWLYLGISGLIAGLFTAFIVWMVMRILTLPTPKLTSQTDQWVAAKLGLNPIWSQAVTLIALNIALGLLFAAMQGRYFDAVLSMPEEPAAKSMRYRLHLATIALVTGGLTFVLASLNDDIPFALAWAAIEAFIYAVIARQVFGVSYNSEIRTVESLGWSWPSAFNGFLVGLAAAALFEVMEWLVFEPDDYYLSMIIPAAGGMLLGGMRGRRVEVKSRPNQGIRLSFKNSFIAATLSALIMAMLVYIVRREDFRIIYAFRLGILIFAVAGALFGGGNVVKHYLVRSLLWLHGDLPRDVIRFLEEAADLVFLRKVGGGYIFIHRLLQQHFASLHPPDEIGGLGQHPLAADTQQLAGRSGGH